MEIMIIPRINIKNPSKFRSDNSKTIKAIFLGLTLKLSIFVNTVKTQAPKIYLSFKSLFHEIFNGQKNFKLCKGKVVTNTLNA